MIAAQISQSFGPFQPDGEVLLLVLYVLLDGLNLAVRQAERQSRRIEVGVSEQHVGLNAHADGRFHQLAPHNTHGFRQSFFSECLQRPTPRCLQSVSHKLIHFCHILNLVCRYYRYCKNSHFRRKHGKQHAFLMPNATPFSVFGKQIVVITLILWATFSKHILKNWAIKRTTNLYNEYRLYKMNLFYIAEYGT